MNREAGEGHLVVELCDIHQFAAQPVLRLKRHWTVAAEVVSGNSVSR